MYNSASDEPASDASASDRPSTPAPFGGVEAEQLLGPLRFTISPAANERYWRAAGVDHELLRAGALYPPMAANLTILAFQTVAPGPLLHTRQRLVCHGRADAPADLTVAGRVTDRFEKRGREYAVVEARIEVALAPRGTRQLLWTSIATFCEVPA